MKQVTIKIPDHKYSFFLELVKNLGLEKVKDNPSDHAEEIKAQKASDKNSVASLRGKLQLSSEQYNDLHLHLKNSRNEWDRGI